MAEKLNLDKTHTNAIDVFEKNIYFEELDGFRALAIIAVMLSHWVTDNLKTHEILRYIPLGSAGVNLFFVLSGFLITRILLLNQRKIVVGKNTSWFYIKQFYIRRSIRIFPIYYLTILIAFLFNYPPSREVIGWLLTYTVNFHVVLRGWPGRFTHLWSLSVEEQFYLIFPFVVLFSQKKQLKNIFLGMIILGVFSRYVFYLLNINPIHRTEVYALLPSCLDAFGFGSILAYMLLYENENLKKIIEKKGLFILIIIMFAVISIYYHWKGFIEGRSVLERFLFSLMCFFIIGRSVTLGWKGFINKVLTNKFMLYIGKISYSLYLFHNFIEEALGKLFLFWKINFSLTDKPILITTLIYFLITLLLSTFSWYVIEKPINSLKEKFV